MFRAILFTQWKWSRLALVPAVLVAFALPLLQVQAAGRGDFQTLGVTELLVEVQLYGMLYPLLAAGVGLLLAVTAWNADHRGRHVYALSLPMPRWEFALLRFGAGGLLLGVAVLAVWFGALLSSASVNLPAGLHTYPTLIALRFGLAALVAFAAFFAVAAGTVRTAGYILAVIAGVVLLQIVLNALSVHFDLINGILDRLFTWPGPLDVFTGRWMLIDV